MHQRQQLGRVGEEAAIFYLEGKGYTILEKNWHAGRYAEIDLICQQGEELVLVEVKARQGIGFGFPEEAVTRIKQEKIQAAAQAFILSHPHLPPKVRFDVIAIILSASGEILNLKHYQNLVYTTN
jgi:putative endonuclease